MSFVICALVEFAIAIVLHRRKESKAALSDVVTKSLIDEKTNKSSLIPEVLKDSHATRKRISDVPTLKTSTAKNEKHNRWVAELGTNLSVVPSTNAIDFMAIWIYFAMFVAFNCVYWNSD